MAASKTDLFNEELQKRANLFRVLAHPARLQILQCLIRKRTCLSGDISDMFPLKRTTVNQHMNELKDAGLIVGHEEGSKIVYCLNTEKVKDAEEILTGFLEEMHLPADFKCRLTPISTN